MPKRFYVQEWRTLDWIVEVPDTISKEDIETCGLEAEDFVDDWTDHGSTEHAYITAHEMPPEEFDDNEADVVLNQDLEVVEGMEDEAETRPQVEIEPQDGQEVVDDCQAL